MEATAVSLGKAVLDGALDYAKSVLSEEIALQFGVEQDVAFITDELEMMQSFLMAADDEQDKHKVLITWVKQVREVAYNVEDNLMDFFVHSDNRPCCWWFIARILWERRGIAKEVKELRTRVEDVSNRNLRYRLIKGSGSKPTTTAEEQASIATAAMSGIDVARLTAMEEQQKPKVDLCHLIDNNGVEDLRVITLLGERNDDIGMISSIREVYDNSTVNSNFGFRAWVTLMHPFDPAELIRSLVRQFYENFPEKLEEKYKRRTVGASVYMKMESMTQSEITDVFDTQVSDNSYLIVIDDLSTIMEWDCIKKYFPDNKKGSRIIVSTRQFNVAVMCAEKPYQISELKQSLPHPTLYAFHKKVVRTSISIPLSTTENTSAIEINEVQEEGQQQSKDGGGDKASGSGAAKKFGRSKTMAVADDVLFGRKSEKLGLIELVGKPEGYHGSKVISVWGMGGIGKTSLVRSVYKSPQLENWKRAWATALRPFNPELLIRGLVKDLIGSSSTGTMDLEQLTDKLTTILKERKCLIVLDDIWSTTEWDLVKSSLENATRIIVTTREKSVAKYCSKQDQNMLNLSGLEEDVALHLFKNKVFRDDAEEIKLLPGMNEQARLILRKCDGLPLAISAIGGFLATKPKTASEWKKTYDRISTELEINPELRTIKTVLVRSYDGLPYHLKSCFLYLSIFPEDHRIRRKPLIRRWVAEGYAREMHGMTAEEVGDKYFEELLDRSMILPGELNIYSGKFDSCQLHDIMRQICISKAREENLSFTLEDECSLSSTQGAIRHLAISTNWKRDMQDVVQRTVDLSHVRSLTVFGDWGSSLAVFGDWGSFFISKKMRFLRVLDLEFSYRIQDHHLNGIGELVHLKLLSLRRNFLLGNLPDSLCNLGNLQTLDVRDTCVRELPPNITNLRKLQFLYGCSLPFAPGLRIPRGIGKLNALCTLGGVRLEKHKQGKDSIKELAQLYQLRKLGVGKVTQSNREEFWSAISSLNSLRSLAVNWTTEESDELDCCLGESLFPPRSIESLKLCGPLVRVTEWIHQLQNLTRLQILETGLQQDAIQAIGKLPNLAILAMKDKSFKGKELVFEQGSFPSLVVLDLLHIEDVPFVKFEDATMPKLELLRIVGLRGLHELSGLRYLTELKEIRLHPDDKKLKDKVQEQLVGHPNKQPVRLGLFPARKQYFPRLFDLIRLNVKEIGDLGFESVLRFI